MKSGEFREMSGDELEVKVQEMETDLWKLRFQASTGQTEGVRKLRSLRKDIARAKTILRERELSESHGR